MQCLEMLFLILVLGTVQAQGPPSFDCTEAGCDSKHQLTYATRDPWNLVATKLDSGTVAEDALYGSGNSLRVGFKGGYCMSIDGSIPFKAIRFGFDIQFGITRPNKPVYVNIDGTRQFTHIVPGSFDEWVPLSTEFTTGCDVMELCIQKRRFAFLRNIYLQICTDQPIGPLPPVVTTTTTTAKPTTTTAKPTTTTAAKPTTTTAKPTTSSMCMDNVHTYFGSTVSGLPTTCPSTLSALPGTLEFQPQITLNLTNAYEVTFSCLNADGNETNSYVTTLPAPGNYIVTSAHLGMCHEVQVFIEWYSDDNSVDNVDMSVCAENNNLLYVACAEII